MYIYTILAYTCQIKLTIETMKPFEKKNQALVPVRSLDFFLKTCFKHMYSNLQYEKVCIQQNIDLKVKNTFPK